VVNSQLAKPTGKPLGFGGHHCHASHLRGSHTRVTRVYPTLVDIGRYVLIPAFVDPCRVTAYVSHLTLDKHAKGFTCPFVS